MNKKFPRVYYVCPCTDITTPHELRGRLDNPPEEDLEEEQPFNPHSPRANYALYPIEHLIFCTECHEIRCPRCYYEEVLSYYCPRCQNESTRAEVKNESNRCPQSCHDCPVCFAPLVVNRYETRVESTQSSDSTSNSFILSCLYCSWTSLELGISFSKSVNISGQLAQILNSGGTVEPETLKKPQETQQNRSPYETTTRFASLADFYRSQLEASNPTRDSSLYLSRVSSTFGTSYLRHQPSKPPPPVREALTVAEGLRVHDPADDTSIIEQMKQLGWSGISNASQRAAQSEQSPILSSARPIATTLLTKRIKRCRTCKRQLVRPESGRNSTRFLVRQVAAKHIPRLTLHFLPPAPAAPSLTPGTPVHILVTFINPLFEAVKVTLATPQTTPGPIASRVTILCPQFDMGPNPDTMEGASSGILGGKSNTVGAVRLSKPEVPAGTTQQPEAGKVWEKGKNWTTVVVEVVPGRVGARAVEEGEEEEKDVEMLRIPVFVRLEYSVDGGGAGAEGGGEGKVAREIAYWSVLDVGRIGGGG